MKQTIKRPDQHEGMRPFDEYEQALINSWMRIDEREQFAALVRLQYNPRRQRAMQEAIERRRQKK